MDSGKENSVRSQKDLERILDTRPEVAAKYLKAPDSKDQPIAVGAPAIRYQDGRESVITGLQRSK